MINKLHPLIQTRWQNIVFPKQEIITPESLNLHCKREREMSHASHERQMKLELDASLPLPYPLLQFV